ncbi:MAG: hypothetical protein PVF27_00230 [Gemmatimonadales bacterium]|jgi:hypothetical protein
MSNRKLFILVAALAVILVGAAAAVTRAGPAAPTALAPTSGDEPACPMSASLLRRLGEAAEAYRTGTDVFIVADCQHPHTVIDVVAEQVAAQRIAAAAGESYSAFGPFRNPAGYGAQVAPTADASGVVANFLVPTCHAEPTEWVSCFATEIWPCNAVDSVTLGVWHRSGRSQTVAFSGCDVDAMFLTIPAIDKFAIPYYLRLWGLEDIASRRNQIVAWSQGASMPDWLRRRSPAQR